MASTYNGALVADGPARLLGRVAAITLLLGFAAVHLAAACAGSLWLCGSAWPWLALALALLASGGLPQPMAVAAFAGACGAWHLPVVAAALLALPQLATWLPGAVAAALARLRHG